MWLDFQARANDYATLSLGERKSFKTFLTHPWMVTTGPRDCLRIVLPKPGGSVVHLR